MAAPPDERHPLAVAMEWVARITTVALEMVLPGLAGDWLDDLLGTSFLVFIGFGLGLTAGIVHLLAMTGSFSGKQNHTTRHPPDRDDLP